MKPIKIDRTVVAAMVEHGTRSTPIEACGYLGERDDRYVTAYPMSNVDASPEHFSFSPNEQFATVKKIRSAGEKPTAIYHSHPATPARPSQEDIKLAFDPDVVYIIVSLAEKEPVVKAFTIQNGEVTSREIEVVNNSTL